jgi:LacI family transcriptional regulator
VATEAGVSQATVSRVVNGNVAVSEPLRDRVMSVVAELGYRRDGLARGLRRQVNDVLGLLVPDIGNPFFTALVRGAEDAALAAGLLTVLCNTDENLAKERKYFDVLLDQRVAGAIVAPVSDRSDVGDLLARGTPIVAVDRRLNGVEVDTVTLDNVAGARQATLFLHEQGYQRVAMITGLGRTTTGKDRRAGYRKAMRSLKKPVPAGYTVDGFNSVEGGYAATQKLLRGENPPDALFIGNNLMAIGALQALADAQLRPTTDIGLLSFDDLPWGTDPAHVIPTVGQPAYRMGRVAAELLIARIADPAAPVKKVVLEPELHPAPTDG